LLWITQWPTTASQHVKSPSVFTWPPEDSPPKNRSHDDITSIAVKVNTAT
jgi:hypothetical protein